MSGDWLWVLLLGLVAFGAIYVIKPGQRWLPACLVMLMGLFVVGQIWFDRDRLRSYQVRVLGQRFSLAEAEGGARVRRGAVAGDRDRAEVYVRGVGGDPIAEFEVVGGDTVFVVSGSGNQGVVAVRRGRADWSLLKSVAVEPGDTIRVGSDDGEAALTFERQQRARFWQGTLDQLVRRVGEQGGAERVRPVPYPQRNIVLDVLQGLRGRPNVWVRTYPLADLFRQTEAGIGSGLNSFLYYDDEDDARLAVLDSGVVVVTNDGERREPVERLAVWEGGGSDDLRFRVAGLPLRDDFREPHLDSVARYGIRRLRDFTARIDSDWLTIERTRPDIHEVRGMIEDRVAKGRMGDSPVMTDDGFDVYERRLFARTGPRAGLALASPASASEAAVEAILRLPYDSTAGWFELLTPSGLARWDTGKSFPLHDGERALLLRVDGLGLSWQYGLLLLGGLFFFAALPFLLVRDASEVTRALALIAVALASLRFLLALSAKARFPFVDEGHAISLALIPAIPWFVFVAGEAFRRWAASTPASPQHRESDVASLPLAARCVIAVVALFFFTLSPLLPTAGALLISVLLGYFAALRMAPRPSWLRTLRTPIVLTFWFAPPAAVSFLLILRLPAPARDASLIFVLAVTLVLVVAWWAWLAFAHVWSSLCGRGDPRSPGSFGSLPGWQLGFILFLIRGGLYLMGIREQIPIPGLPRVGISVFYTPLALVLFVFILAYHDCRVSSAGEDKATRATVLSGVDLCVFLLLAYGVTSLVISDLGILLTTLPGPSLVLAWVGFRWCRDQSFWPRLVCAVPLLFVVIPQFLPGVALSLYQGYQGVQALIEGDRRDQLIEPWARDRNELLLISHSNPEELRRIGERRSEAIGVTREVMRSYTSGNVVGHGFLEGEVSEQIQTTATYEHLVAALLANQWGLLGTFGLLFMLAAVGVAPVVLRPAPSSEDDRPSGGPEPSSSEEKCRPELFRMLSLAALWSFSLAGIYMILANYSWTLFTGKNVYLLAPDSLSDTAEALLLLGLGAWAWTQWKEREAAGPVADADGKT